MTYEEAQKEELEAVPGLSNKVFPLYAPKDAKAPYLVYRKENVRFKKTLGGILNKTEAIYEIVLVANRNSELQQLSQDVVNAMFGFYCRPIGSGGPLIEDVTVEIMGDAYDANVDQVIQNIQLKVNY